jgi:hypothetical protein
MRRLNFPLDKSEIDAIVACKPGAVENLLMRLQRHMAEIRAGKRQLSASTEPGAGGGPSFQSYSVGEGGVPLSSYAGGGAGGGAGVGVHFGGGVDADTALLAEKDAAIAELQETISILELKVKKLEQLVRLKDSRIQTLTAKVAGVTSL